MNPEWGYLLSAIIGGCVGSFLNVCIYRIPRNISIINPSSYCISCKNPLRFYHNIPLISYIMLGGRCAYCKESIPIRYFIVEAIMLILSTLLYHVYGFTPLYAANLIFSSALVAVTFIDLEHRIIPDIISIPGMIAGLIMSFFILDISPFESLIGLLTGAGGLLVVALAYEYVTKREGMGGGDVKLVGMIGAFMGWKGAFTSIFLGSLLGTIIGITIMVIEKKDLKIAIPFGPFLSIGALFYLFFGKTNVLNPLIMRMLW